MKFPRGLVVLAFSAVVIAGPAMAKDFCLSKTGSTVYIVGKGFKLPTKGKCKPFSGVFELADLVSGNACTKSDGSGTYFNLTFSPETGVENVSIILDLTMMSGTAFDCFDVMGSTTGPHCSSFGVSVIDCPSANMPIL